MKSEYNSVSVVIPVYNAEKTIEELFFRLAKLAKDYEEFEIILVDDSSDDKSWEKIIELSKLPNVKSKMLRLSRNFGQHPAILAGVKESNNKWIAILDCDLQDEPENLTPLLSLMEIEGAQIGHVLDVNKKRRIMTRVFHFIASRKYSIPNNITSFRIISAEICNKAMQYSDFSMLSGPVIDQMGFKRSYIFAKRIRSSTSTLTIWKRWEFATKYLINHTTIIPKILGVFSLFTIITSVYYGLVIIYHKIISEGSLPNGLNQIVILELIIIGFITGVFSFIIFLLLNILERIKNYPAYHIQDKIYSSLE